MDQDKGSSAVELGHDRFERRITEIDTVHIGQDVDAIESEGVERPLQLGQLRGSVDHRQAGEGAKAAWVVGNRRRSDVIDVPGESDLI